MQKKPKVIRNFKGYATKGKPKNCLVLIDVMSCVHLDGCKLSRRTEQMLVGHHYNQIQFWGILNTSIRCVQSKNRINQDLQKYFIASKAQDPKRSSKIFQVAVDLQ